MTTFHQERVSCAVCGHTQEVRELASTNSSGSMDLDMRPPEMARTARLAAIATCESCGYSAPDLEQLPEDVTPDDLAPVLQESDGGSLWGKWASWSVVNEVSGRHRTAGWAALHAAWACDDAGLEALAVEYRLRAAEAFDLARRAGQSFAGDPTSERLLRADVLRRAGAFDAALEEVRGLAAPTTDLLARLISFEQALIARGDAGRYTVEDATE